RPGRAFRQLPGVQVAVRARRALQLGLGRDHPRPFAQFKGTLGESGVGALQGGGALVPVPQVAPGLVSTLFQPLTVEQAFSAAIATGSWVRSLTQGTATSGAAGAAGGGLKPESQLGFVTADEPIKKIATFLPVSEEVLEDAASRSAFINGQLIAFVQ